jgi:hypothetical protein
LTLSRPVHADFSISTFDCLTKFLKLTLSRSVHADFFSAFNTLTNFTTSDAFATCYAVATSNSSFAKFGPIVRNSDHYVTTSYVRIRTIRSEFGPFTSDSDHSIGIRTITSLRRYITTSLRHYVAASFSFLSSILQFSSG